jgi:flagellar basal-body rod modification protein FlgD
MADAISGIGSAATTGKASQDQKKLADDLNDFMTLLTTQLQHQDPLDPMDATEFTSQLVQFASVEQQIAGNKNLETLISAQENSQLASVAGYVGHYIEAESSSVQVYGGQAEFNYILLADSDSTLINIQDVNGNTVMSAKGNVTQGKHGVVWDGLDLSGNKVPDGIYQLKVVAQDGEGSPVDVVTTSIGVVSGVSYAGKEPVLMINNQEIGLDKVLTLKEKALQLTEVDSIAASSLSAAASAKVAAAASEAATASAAEAEAAALANPIIEAEAEAVKATEAAAKAAKAATEAAQAAELAKNATSAEVASQAAQTAASAAATANAAKATAAAAAKAAAEAVPAAA